MRSRRGAHILKTVLVLALYAAITSGNAALHGLLGCGVGERTETADAARDHGAKHLCSVCHFLSQVQLAAERPHIDRAEIVGVADSNDGPLVLQAESRVQALPRAPPTPV